MCFKIFAIVKKISWCKNSQNSISIEIEGVSQYQWTSSNGTTKSILEEKDSASLHLKDNPISLQVEYEMLPLLLHAFENRTALLFELVKESELNYSLRSVSIYQK